MFGTYIIDFAPEKNEWLKLNRGVCFDDVANLWVYEGWVSILPHSDQQKYPGQLMAIFKIKEEYYVVPFVADHDKQSVFLKTLYPSRQARKRFNKEGNEDG